LQRESGLKAKELEMRVFYAVTGIALMAALAGCDRTSYSYQPAPATLAPLQPQPIEGVQSSDLSPPGQAQNLGPGQFPAAPGSDTGAQVASVNTAPPANSLDVTKEQMVGGWNVNSGGTSCKMFLTLTKFGNASRGGTAHCVGQLMTMRAWDVSGKQITLMDSNGNPIGRLYKTAQNQYDGSMNSGAHLSLSR
jgi:hypothetical protein